MAVQDPSLARQPPQISEDDVDDSVLELRGIVQRKSEAIGLAIVIGILNASGVHDDVENVSSTFEQLKFAVWKKENTSLKALYRIVLAAAKYGETYRYPLSYKFITFYFAGHGGSDDGHSFVCPAYLRGQPKPKLFIEEGIVSPFRPKNAPQLKYMYRLFFFDCCLNDPNRDDTTEHAVPKQMKLPAHANCLVAYGTSMEYYSKGYKGKGGVWTGYLCENLRNYDLPITTILDITHSQVIKNSMEIDDNQAPHYVSCVGVVYLKDPQRSWKYLLVQDEPPHNPPGGATTTSQPTQDKLPVTISEETKVDDTILSTDEGLLPVLKATVGVNNWHKLSIALGLPTYQQSHDSTEVIQRWLDTGSASWSKLVEALKNPLVAQKGLADSIAAAHRK